MPINTSLIYILQDWGELKCNGVLANNTQTDTGVGQHCLI